jgi:hypothetical protein
MSANLGDQRNWFEKLTSKIPGYSGYVDKERRRDTDKLQREHIADRLRGFKNPLTDVMRGLSSGGRLFEVSPVDHDIKKLDRIENRIRFASYGYAGFFDVVKVDGPRLDYIYQTDLALIEHVDQLEASINQLKGMYGTADGLRTAASQVDAALDTLEKAFEARFNAVNNFGQGPPPGGEQFYSAPPQSPSFMPEGSEPGKPPDGSGPSGSSGGPSGQSA